MYIFLEVRHPTFLFKLDAPNDLNIYKNIIAALLPHLPIPLLKPVLHVHMMPRGVNI
jgi:hypothetical protein